MEQMQETSIALRFRQDNTMGGADMVPREHFMHVFNNLHKTVNLVARINEALADRETSHTRLIVKNRFDFIVDCRVLNRHKVFSLNFNLEKNREHSGIEDVVSAVVTTSRLLGAFSRNDRNDFFEIIPDRSFQKTLVDKICKMFRRYNDGSGFEIADHKFNIIADIADVVRNAESLKNSYEEPGTCSVAVGRINSINLKNRRLSLLVAGSEKAVSCVYSDRDQPMLLKVLLKDPLKLIEIQGMIELDLDGLPAKVRDVTMMCPVETSDIPVSDVLPDHLELREPEGPLFSVNYEEEGQCYTAILDEIDSHVIADTRQDLMELLKFHLLLKWRDVAMEDDENLARDMIEVKTALKRIFREKST